MLDQTILWRTQCKKGFVSLCVRFPPLCSLCSLMFGTQRCALTRLVQVSISRRRNSFQHMLLYFYRRFKALYLSYNFAVQAL